MPFVILAHLLLSSLIFQSLFNETLLLPTDTPDTENGLDLASRMEMDLLINYLSQALQQDDWRESMMPLMYVEDMDDNYMPSKRTRYYRRYPWKRQNNRERSYVDDNRYLCNPTREDVFELLVALHEARGGNYGRTVNFCNRKRPVSAIFTNIRFLGKRRK